jgi:hypothetical protein
MGLLKHNLVYFSVATTCSLLMFCIFPWYLCCTCYWHWCYYACVGRVAQSVYRLTTGWTVRGSNLLASGTQDRGFAPDRSRRIFPAGKIHSMPSFGKEVKIICPKLVARTTKGNNRSKETVKKGQLWYIKKKIPVGTRFFAHVQTGPGAHPASCTVGTGSFPGVKRPGRGANHPLSPSAEVENE